MTNARKTNDRSVLSDFSTIINFKCAQLANLIIRMRLALYMLNIVHHLYRGENRDFAILIEIMIMLGNPT